MLKVDFPTRTTVGSSEVLVVGLSRCNSARDTDSFSTTFNNFHFDLPHYPLWYLTAILPQSLSLHFPFSNQNICHYISPVLLWFIVALVGMSAE